MQACRKQSRDFNHHDFANADGGDEDCHHDELEEEEEREDHEDEQRPLRRRRGEARRNFQLLHLRIPNVFLPPLKFCHTL